MAGIYATGIFFAQNRRAFHDVLALVLHIACIIGISVQWNTQTNSIRKPIATSFFLGQELVALVAHIYYIYVYVRRNLQSNWWNEYKWYEYAFSATLGTVATFNAGVEPDAFTGEQKGYFALLIIVGFIQQLCGRYVDNPAATECPWPLPWVYFAVAFVCQAIEILIVLIQTPPVFISIVYVTLWTTFGIHAGLRLHVLDQQRDASSEIAKWRAPWLDLTWTESVYSYLGWAAKIGVILMAVPDAFIDINARRGAYAVMCVAAVAIVLLTYAGLFFMWRSKTNARSENFFS
tara:strand:- start:5762 stop:6634 length:873 start_codon:yes stop_codon:yes gene_type:complete